MLHIADLYFNTLELCTCRVGGRYIRVAGAGAGVGAGAVVASAGRGSSRRVVALRCGRRQAQAQRRIVQSTAASWRSSSELHCPLPITPSRPLSPPRSPPHAPSSTPISLRTPPQTRRLNLSHGLVGGAVQPPRRCGRGPDGAAAARAVQRRPRPVAQVCPAPSCPSAALLASSLVCGHTG